MPFYRPTFLSPIPDDLMLLRIVPRHRAVEMAKISALYLPRPWQFEDKLEGKLYESEAKHIWQTESEKGQPEAAALILAASLRLPSFYAVSCWRDFSDGLLHWDRYGGEADKVSLITSVAALKAQIPPEKYFTIGRVSYVDPQNYGYQGNYPDRRIFEKSCDYSWEKEVRLVVNEGQGGILSPAESVPGFAVPIDFNTLVSRVIDQSGHEMSGSEFRQIVLHES